MSQVSYRRACYDPQRGESLHRGSVAPRHLTHSGVNGARWIARYRHLAHSGVNGVRRIARHRHLAPSGVNGAGGSHGTGN
jgi:hypothetical protein